MHHTVHIGASTLQPVSRVLLPEVKGPDDSRFREAFSASIRPIASSKPASEEQPKEDDNHAPSTKAIPAVTSPVDPSSRKDREPLKADDATAVMRKPVVDGRSKPVETNATTSAKATEAQLPQAAPAVTSPVDTSGVKDREPLKADSTDAPAAAPTPVLALDAAPVSAGTVKSEVDGGSKPVETNATTSTKATEVQLPQAAPAVVAPKKALHRGAAEAVTIAQSTVADAVALPPKTPQPEPPAPVPVSVAPPIPDGTKATKPEQAVTVVDAPAKVPKSRAPVASGQTVTHDAKKADASATVSPAEPKPDATSQSMPILPPATPHDIGHLGTSIVPQVVAAGSIIGPHVPVSQAGVSVAKTSDLGSAQTVSEGGSQATDLKTLVATPNVLEVGIASGSHGWLRVRAEFGQMGEVAASVVAASDGAAQGLHKELPALSAYLVGERVGVSSLVVNAAEKGAGAQDATLNSGAGGAAGSQAGSNKRGGDVPSGQTSVVGSEIENSGGDSDAGFTIAPVNLPRALHANGSGGWLSVRV